MAIFTNILWQIVQLDTMVTIAIEHVGIVKMEPIVKVLLEIAQKHVKNSGMESFVTVKV